MPTKCLQTKSPMAGKHCKIQNLSRRRCRCSQDSKKMVRNLHEKQMYRKLSYITKGSHSCLGYTEVPISEWYYSPKSDKLFHHSNGFFESHAANSESHLHFHQHHTLKVIPGTAFEANVIRGSIGYRPRVPSSGQSNTEQNLKESYSSGTNATSRKYHQSPVHLV